MNKIIISRIDGIGDVVLTLPLAGLLKEIFPQIEIIFIGKKYTRAVVDCCSAVNQFIDIDELFMLSNAEQIRAIKELAADCIIHISPNKIISQLAKKAGIPLRIGTSYRLFHWLTCNKLVNLSRKKSSLHEAQLNLSLAVAIGAKEHYSLSEILDYLHFEAVKTDSFAIDLLDKNRFNLVLHPKSKGNAREWSENNFARLIELLPADRFNIFISGTKAEGEQIKQTLLIPFTDRIIDITGRLSLAEFISFLSQTDGIVSNSTGPLHIGSALGINAIGLYPPIQPMHPGRWSPIGKKAKVFVADRECQKCRKTKICSCMDEIKPEQVAEYLVNMGLYTKLY